MKLILFHQEIKLNYLNEVMLLGFEEFLREIKQIQQKLTNERQKSEMEFDNRNRSS